jgi:hypothetical protein
MVTTQAPWKRSNGDVALWQYHKGEMEEEG